MLILVYLLSKFLLEIKLLRDVKMFVATGWRGDLSARKNPGKNPETSSG